MMNYSKANTTICLGAFFWIIALLILAPPFIHYTFLTTSHAVGILLCLPFIGAYYYYNFYLNNDYRIIEKFFRLLIPIVFLILLNIFIASIRFDLAIFRSILSLVLLISMFFTSYIVSDIFYHTRERDFDQTIKQMAYILIIIGAFAILGLYPYEYPDASNPIFPFSEPSHYALYAGAPIAYLLTVSKSYLKIIYLILLLIIAYLIKSQSLVLLSVIFGIITIRIYIILGLAAIFVIYSSLLDFTYFTDRLNILSDNENLSILVYRQGWELMIDALQRSSGLGVGFQQLGFAPFNSYTAELIYQMTRNDVNLKDGGFNAAKLISELGVIGFAVTSWLTTKIVRSYIFIYGAARNATYIDRRVVFCQCVLASYTIELFARGIGYFSVPTLLVIASIIFLSRFPAAETPDLGKVLSTPVT